MGYATLGIDIGGTMIKFGGFDAAGTLVDRWEQLTDRTDRGEHVLSQIHESILAHGGYDGIEGIGFAVCGPVAGDVVRTAVNLGWRDFDLAAAFRRLAGIDSFRIRVANDANAAALGEVADGAAKGLENVVLITLGTGIGAGVIVNGNIVAGKDGVAGELGHLAVDGEFGFPCNCGKTGCLETIASAKGLVRVANRLLATTDTASVLRGIHDLKPRRILEAAQEEDGLALKTVEIATRHLGAVTASLLLSLNPDMILFGGGIATGNDFLVRKIARYAFERTAPFAVDTPILPAGLGNDAGIVGAARLVR